MLLVQDTTEVDMKRARTAKSKVRVRWTATLATAR